MFNPFSLIVDIATAIVDIQEENEEIRRNEALKKRRIKENAKYLKAKKEREIWLEVTEDSYKNPDEYMVLPYGWSPFGIYL